MKKISMIITNNLSYAVDKMNWMRNDPMILKTWNFIRMMFVLRLMRPKTKGRVIKSCNYQLIIQAMLLSNNHNLGSLRKANLSFSFQTPDAAVGHNSNVFSYNAVMIRDSNQSHPRLWVDALPVEPRSRVRSI